MPRALKPADAETVEMVRNALSYLRAARDSLTESGAAQSADKVRAAIKSAEGALRHAQRRAAETQSKEG